MKSLNQRGSIAPELWVVFSDERERIEGDLELGNLAPHDLRRTCARLCRESGGALEQIQLLLGHASVQTTMNYLGTRQNLVEAVNDRLGIAVAEDSVEGSNGSQ